MKIIKNLYAYILAFISIFLIISCNATNEKLAITYYKNVNSLNRECETDSDTTHYEYLDYDSVRFSDGSWATSRLEFAPQNTLTEFFNKQGYTSATISQASECCPQIIIYDYDDKGRLVHLMYPKFQQIDSIYNSNITKNDYLAFRQMIEELDFEHPDTLRFKLTNIEYDEEGNVKKVSVYNNKSAIEAPQGYKLTISVKPCTSFWESDLRGGFYVFHTKIEPKTEHLNNFKISRFVNFTPTMDSYFQNGNFVKVVWHPNPSETQDNTSITYHPIKKDDFNLYTEQQENGNKLQFAYYKGLLAYQQLISKYGTVLKKKTYSFLSNNEVLVTTECIDYKTKKMRVKSTRIKKVNNMDNFHEGMNLSPSI